MPRNQFDLSGKIAVVAGASRGIGQEVAKILGECGAHVIALSRGADVCAETLAAIEACRSCRIETATAKLEGKGARPGWSRGAFPPAVGR